MRCSEQVNFKLEVANKWRWKLFFLDKCYPSKMRRYVNRRTKCGRLTLNELLNIGGLTKGFKITYSHFNQHCNRSIFETRDVIIIRWNVFFWFSRLSLNKICLLRNSRNFSIKHIFKEAYLFPFILFDCCSQNLNGTMQWLPFSKKCKFHFVLWISLFSRYSFTIVTVISFHCFKRLSCK